MSCCLWTAEADVRKKKFQSSKLILGPKTPLFLGVLALVCTICVGGCKRSWPLITLTFAFCLLPLIAFHPLGVKVPKSKLIRSHERCLLLKSAGQWPWKSESAKECVTARGWQSKESYWPRRLCVRHPRWRLQCVAGHCYYQLSVFFLCFFFSLSVFWFWPTLGKLPCVKICFPQYFGIARYVQKKNVVTFIFLRNPLHFLAFYGQRSVTAAWATPSPWSMKIFNEEGLTITTECNTSSI